MNLENISIWSFIAAILAIYGVIIMGAGIYYMFRPASVALMRWNVSLWWGAVLLVFGLAFQWLHTRFGN